MVHCFPDRYDLVIFLLMNFQYFACRNNIFEGKSGKTCFLNVKCVFPTKFSCVCEVKKIHTKKNGNVLAFYLFISQFHVINFEYKIFVHSINNFVFFSPRFHGLLTFTFVMLHPFLFVFKNFVSSQFLCQDIKTSMQISHSYNVKCVVFYKFLPHVVILKVWQVLKKFQHFFEFTLKKKFSKKFQKSLFPQNKISPSKKVVWVGISIC